MSAKKIKEQDINYPTAGVSKKVNLARLDYFSTLKENWNGFTAQPIMEEIIEFGKQIVELAETQPEIFPLPNGTLQFEWENDNIYIELHPSLDQLWGIFWMTPDYHNVEAKVRNNPKYALTTVQKLLEQYK
ncbi:MAG: hypothetical protein NC218_04000 [Acetobacter sp.]|nr:hypothetical protein [Acetobacter sp.]